MSPVAIGRTLVVLAAIGWSWSGVAIKRLPPAVTALPITGWRSLITLIFLLVVFALAAGDRATMRHALLRSMRAPAAWGAAFAYAAMLILFISATCATTAANAILLQYTAPIHVALWSWPLLGEPVRRRDWLAIAGVLIGMVCFFAERLTPGGWWGNVLAILSGFACGMNMLCLRLVARRPADAVSSPAWSGPAEGSRGLVSAPSPPTAPASSPAWSSDDPPSTAAELLVRALPAVLVGNLLAVGLCLPWMGAAAAWEPTTWATIVGLGVGQLGLPYLLFVIGLGRIDAVEGVLLATLEAVLNPVWTALGAGEIPSWWAVAGGALILLSITWFAVGRTVGAGRPSARLSPEPQPDLAG